MQDRPNQTPLVARVKTPKMAFVASQAPASQAPVARATNHVVCVQVNTSENLFNFSP
jgi:hypothetical protein